MWSVRTLWPFVELWSLVLQLRILNVISFQVSENWLFNLLSKYSIYHWLYGVSLQSIQLWMWNYLYSAAAAAKSLESCSTLCDPIDGSPPGSPVPGILQARTPEWVAISFSSAWKWKVKVTSLGRVRLCALGIGKFMFVISSEKLKPTAPPSSPAIGHLFCLFHKPYSAYEGSYTIPQVS